MTLITFLTGFLIGAICVAAYFLREVVGAFEDSTDALERATRMVRSATATEQRVAKMLEAALREKRAGE